MESDWSDLREPWERLRWARTQAGWDKQSAAAESLGMKPITYRTYERRPDEAGSRSFDHHLARRFGQKFKVSWVWLLTGEGDPKGSPSPEPTLPPRPMSTPGDPVNLADLRAYLANHARHAQPVGKLRPIDRKIPVVGDVAAGLWRETPIKEAQDVEEWIDLDVQGYERAQLRAMRVVGPSMNLVYPEGRFVVIAHPAEAGLRVGDYVVVRRSRAGLSEITLKEFVVEDDGRVALWPRSSHPDFQQPYFLKDNEEEGVQVGTVIVGVVVADYGRRERPPVIFERTTA